MITPLTFNTPSTARTLTDAAPPPPAASAPAPRDAFSVKKAVLGGIVGFMGRRIPTTVREISDEQRDHVIGLVQPGDILLSTSCDYPGLARMEFWTVRSDYTHAAIYEGNGKFLEATTPGGVKRSDLREYAHGRQKLAVIRPPYKTAQDREAALEYCRTQLGKEYDSAFNAFKAGSDNEFYCSELVYKALKSMPNPIEAPTHTCFGKEAIAPDAFFSLDGAQTVFDGNSGYWKNKLGHWPLALAAVGGAAAGHAMGGVGGAAAGFGVGLLGSILVGNKIQTGYFLPSVHDIREAKRLKAP